MLDLEPIKKRCADATPGPLYGCKSKDHKEFVIREPENGAEVARVRLLRDAEFFAHARTDIPALVAEVERLRAELERTERERDAAVCDLAGHGRCCETCGHNLKGDFLKCSRCEHNSGNWHSDEDNWQWRGLPQEGAKSD